MKFFEDTELMAYRFNKLGLKLLEGFLSEDLEKINEVYETMEVLKYYFQDTFEFSTLKNNKIDVDVWLRLANSVREDGKEYKVSKDFEMRYVGEGADDYGTVRFEFPAEKMTGERLWRYKSRIKIRAKACYISYIEGDGVELYSERENLTLAHIKFLQNKKDFESLFLKNNLKEVAKEKGLEYLELDHIEIEVI